MACGVNCMRRDHAPVRSPARTLRGARAEASRARRNLRKTQFEVSGTWDFKWPLGTRIRVAFQRPPAVSDSDFERARARVIELASRWTPYLPADRLELDFSLPSLDPPLGDGSPVIDRHRSSFLLETAREVPYDVLVSLEPLPIVLEDPFRGPKLQKLTLDFPVSDIGSYSRRGDYGAPTIHVGPFGKFGASFVDYFQMPVAEHVIVHEFGHVLGLTHLHQHPRLIAPDRLSDDVRTRLRQLDEARENFYRDPTELRDLMRRLLGVENNLEQVKNHVTRVWRGNEAFSDWVEFSGDELRAHRKQAVLDSVMSVPFYECMRKGHEPCPVCKGEVTPTFVTRPGAKDIQSLGLMYDFVTEAKLYNAAE